MSSLPLPLRVAAGLVVTAVEQAKELPRMSVELPVTAVSQVMQASMRLQQVVTELAIKGDRALSMLRRTPEQPTWARFDEDEVDGEAATIRASFRTDRADDRASFRTTDRAADGGAESAGDRRAAARTSSSSPAIEPEPAAEPTVNGSSPDDAPLPGYDELTIAQLRARLRRMSVETLHELLIWETGHQNRPPFVTMLTNRIASVSEE